MSALYPAQNSTCVQRDVLSMLPARVTAIVKPASSIRGATISSVSQTQCNNITNRTYDSSSVEFACLREEQLFSPTALAAVEWVHTLVRNFQYHV
jgi:hypothetical protein